MTARARRRILIAGVAGGATLLAGLLLIANSGSPPAHRSVSDEVGSPSAAVGAPLLRRRYPDLAEGGHIDPINVPEGAGLRLRVRSSSGDAIASFRVTNERTEEFETFDSTEGPFFVPCGPEPDALLVEAPEHVPQVLPVADVRAHVEGGETLECVLIRTYHLGGRAVWPGGRAGPPGVTVLAWPASSPPDVTAVVEATRTLVVAGDESEEDDERGAGEQPRLLVTTTDSQGEFEFPDPVPDGRYVLTLGGRGIAPDRRVIATPSRQTSYRIEVRAVFGLGIQLITPEGEYLPGLRTMRSATPSFGFVADGVAGVSFRSPPTIERCLLDPLLTAPEEHGIHYVMLMATADHQQVGPLRVFARHPGRTPVTADLLIPTLANGLELTTITLPPSGIPTGSLEIQVVGWSQAVEGLEPGSIVLSLKLRPSSKGGPQSLETAVFDGTWFEGDTLTVSGIQHGEYSVELDFGALNVRLSLNASISDDPERLVFSLADLDAGSILILVQDRAGRPFTGRAEFDLSRQDGRHESSHVFPAAPYRIPVVGPGRYHVAMLAAFAGEGDYPTARSGIVEVQRGEQATVSLTFDQMN